MKNNLLKIVSLILIIAFSLMLVSCTSPEHAVEGDPVKPSLTVEAGGSLPVVSDFMAVNTEAELVTDITGFNTVPGAYEVEIKSDGKSYISYLIVEDNQAPAGDVHPLQVKPGTPVSADDFFDNISDATSVRAVFIGAKPDTSEPCACDVKLALVDAGLNESEYSSRLIVSELDPVTLEARPDALKISEFSSDSSAAFTKTGFVPDTVGEYEIGIRISGKENFTVLTVVDTTAPSGDPKELNAYTKHDILPEELVDNAFDMSQPITFEYAQQPDLNREGSQQVTVVMTDACGNSSEITSTMILDSDTEAPVLYGINDVLYLPQGGTVSYMKDVYAEDNVDAFEDIKIEVDKSTVDPFTIGSYDITYTATDISGNSSQKQSVLQVIEPREITEEMLNGVIAETLAEITTDDMTVGEKAFAIYNYVRDKVVYNGESDKEDYIGEAYRGLTDFKGDCFTFYASTDALLKAIGAETMKVSREYNTTRPTHHYWVKCNLGTGWYHIDTTNTGPKNFEAFMRTDDAFLDRAPTYWLFDRHKYPESPKTAYEKDWE